MQSSSPQVRASLQATWTGCGKRPGTRRALRSRRVDYFSAQEVGVIARLLGRRNPFRGRGVCVLRCGSAC